MTLILFRSLRGNNSKSITNSTSNMQWISNTSLQVFPMAHMTIVFNELLLKHTADKSKEIFKGNITIVNTLQFEIFINNSFFKQSIQLICVCGIWRLLIWKSCSRPDTQ